MRLLALAAAALLALPATARAQFAVYTDVASFLAATSAAGTDTFDDLAPGTVLDSLLARTAGAYGYTATASVLDFTTVGAGGDAWLSTSLSSAVITLSGFGPAVRGVGGFFFGTDFLGDLLPGATLTVRATDASGTETRTLVAPGPETFLGFVSAGPITSLAVEALDSASNPGSPTYPTVNNLVLAAAPAVVPEPTTVLLVGAGVLGLAAAARRRA